MSQEKIIEEQTDLEENEQDESISDEDTVYQINTFGTDFDVDGLVRRFERGDIFRPKFQRNFVWTWPQASKFIESILLGLPIPSVFLYREEESQKHLIVDGLQRLTTLHAYATGRLPNNDRVFKLKDVKSRFEGKTISELEPEDQRRFENAVIHAFIIQQTSPNNDSSSVFHIFDRLNSNGTPLQPQEIRAAIYHGNFQNMLGELNENSSWREIFGPVHKRSKDQELILRFFALLNNQSNYIKPMKKFLNDYMGSKRNINEIDRNNYSSVFINTITRIHEALDSKPFRPQRGFNVAMFDAFTVAVARNPEADKAHIKKAYNHLLSDNFMSLISDSTSDEANVKSRIDAAMRAFDVTA